MLLVLLFWVLQQVEQFCNIDQTTPSAARRNDGSSYPETGFACHRAAVQICARTCAVQELASLRKEKSQLIRLRAQLPAATLRRLGWSAAPWAKRLPLPRLLTGPDAACAAPAAPSLGACWACACARARPWPFIVALQVGAWEALRLTNWGL